MNKALAAIDTATTKEWERARRIILRHGWAATSYQLLNPDLHLWFAPECDALVGYTRRAGVRVVAGAPVAAGDRLEEVASRFEAEAKAEGESVCYFGSEGRLATLYRGRGGYAELPIGGQPVWDPRTWLEHVSAHSSLRAQLNRARNKAVTVEHWPRAKACNHPKLKTLLDDWLGKKPLPPLHFLTEPQLLGRLGDRQVFVARQRKAIVGYAVATPVAGRGGWLVEQIIRRSGAPNGTSELLVDAVARMAAQQESPYLTLGLAPLAERLMPWESIRPTWLRWLLQGLRRWGASLYNFAGLEHFKAKFKPERWEPVYALATEETFSVRSAYAIAAAFSGGSPLRWGTRLLGRAAIRRLA